MYDIVILGGGSGDLAAAGVAAGAGARVALVREAREAADPSLVRMALGRAARVAREVKDAAGLGIRVGEVEVDFRAVMERARSLAGGSEATRTLEGLKARGVDIYCGRPSFESYDTVVLDDGTRLSASRFAIVRRARPEIPFVPGLDRVGFVDEGSVGTLEARPETLLVLGTGAAAIELAQAFARLGSKVTVVGEAPRILPEEDFEVSAKVRELLAAEGLAFHLGMQVTGVVERAGRVVVKFRNPANGDPFEAERTHLLVATRSRADLDGLNLEAAGVEIDGGSIRVDDALLTTSRHIAAVDPSLGEDAAAYQATLAVQNLLVPSGRKVDHASLPRMVFTDPAVASVGLSEERAREDDPDVRVARLEFGRLDRARVDGRTEGLAKLVATPGGKILGATFVGPEAGEAVATIALAMGQGLTVHDLTRAIPPHFTYAAGIWELARQIEERGRRGFVQNALRWVYGYGARGGDVEEARGRV